MKKKTFVIILSTIEIISIIIFIATFGTAFRKSIEMFLNKLMSKWIEAKEVIITPREKIIISINNITTYIFLISIILRTIFTNKKSRIAILIILFSAYLSFYVYFESSIPKTIADITAIILAITTIIAYIYSHIVYFKDIIKIQK